MLNFTVGPVQTWPEILEIGGKFLIFEISHSQK